jgi:hypothetical protein
VTMELMDKAAKYDGPIKVRDVSRWPLDSQAVQFLLATGSAYSIKELEKVEKQVSLAAHPLTSPKHPLFSYKRRESDMIDIRANVYTAEFSVFRGHDVPSQP